MFDQLCGFCSVLPFPHKFRKNTFRLHRTVVLPDFQGVGIGYTLSNFVAEHYHRQGKSIITNISNPALIRARSKDKKWAVTKIGRTSHQQGKNSKLRTMKKSFAGARRLTVSFEYISGK